MALIKCVDCGKRISDHAPACIHCGCPISISQKAKTTIEPSAPVETKEDEESSTGCLKPLLVSFGLSVLCLLSVVALVRMPDSFHRLRFNPFKSEPKRQITLSVGTCDGAGTSSELEHKLLGGWKVVSQSSFTQEERVLGRRFSCNRTDYTLEK